ncbi:Uncharacterised protein [uncultured archaeon]|nr:Uncharacterised protein [uncultured archaeon]
MKRSFIILASFLALLLAFGCAQQPVSSTACSGVVQDRLVNCIYVNAVSEQNPYYCYEISSAMADARKTCLADASDYAKKKALERMTPAERDMLLVPNATSPAPSAAVQAPTETPAAAVEEQPGAAITANMTDNETYTAAVAGLSIKSCEPITDTTLHNSCISQIAQKTKNIASCATLALVADQDLCNAYAQG